MAADDDIAPESPITALTPEECWEMLGSEQLGRLIVSVDGRIDVFPINFVAHDGEVYFRTAEGTKLVELTVHDDVVFEVDHVGSEVAWSVVVHGIARRLTHAREIAAVEKLQLRSWVPTLKFNYVEITPTEISGRRVQLGEDSGRYPD